MKNGFNNSNCLIIGFGSIGKRHAKILSENDCTVTIITESDASNYPTFKNIEHPDVDLHQFNYIIISKETSAHYATLVKLSDLGYCGTVLVEKPLFSRNTKFQLKVNFEIFVGYNLRFHPALLELKKQITGKNILSAQIYCGSYLPNWRPSQDYRIVESSSSPDYGGVVRELSHELDYITWLFGDLANLSILRGSISKLDIQADDLLLLTATSDQCRAISLQLNYFDKIGNREIRLSSDESSYVVDLNNHTFQENDEIIKYQLDTDYTYLKMHEAILTRKIADVCDINQGIDVVKLVDTINNSPELGSD